MSEPNQPSPDKTQDREDLSTLFAQLVLQLSNMAMMLLGKVPHPDSGQTITDIDAARLFIDQLEMLEIKTKGNLTREEQGLLKQSLMALRLSFVEAVDKPPSKAEPGAQPQASTPSPAPAQSSEDDEEHKKKFSKKY